MEQESNIPPIDPPDSHHASAALGWLELGDTQEARVELGRLDSGLEWHPLILEIRWRLSAAENDWADGVGVATELVKRHPDLATGWLHRAYALRRAPGGGVEAAREALLPAWERFPKEPTIPYNLACYECVLGELETARGWLKQAMEVGRRQVIRSMALADDDLRPLWAELRAAE